MASYAIEGSAKVCNLTSAAAAADLELSKYEIDIYLSNMKIDDSTGVLTADVQVVEKPYGEDGLIESDYVNVIDSTALEFTADS